MVFVRVRKSARDSQHSPPRKKRRPPDNDSRADPGRTSRNAARRWCVSRPRVSSDPSAFAPTPPAPPRRAAPPPGSRLSAPKSPSLLPSPLPQAARLLADPEADGWERTDFPVVCEDCLGPNPYIRMQKQDYAAECAISGRPFTVFRWRPGNDARYKKTVVCREIALAKNVCQVCLLDLDYGIPVQARDAALGRANEMQAKSDVNVEYQTEQIARRLENGEDVAALAGVGGAGGKARANEILSKMARKKPYYNKNKTAICTFWLRNACTRADCPYRPCNGDTHMPELTSAPEMRSQNIKDRYYGVNDPVAEKMLKRAESTPALKPPEDASITTLYVGGIDQRVTEDDLRDAFYSHGELKSVRCVHAKNCAFVTYVDRKGAEAAAEALHGNLVVNGLKLRLMWGKPAKPKGDRGAPGGAGAGGSGAGASGSGAGAGAGAGAPVGFVPVPMPFQPPTGAGARAAYPSADPSAMGTRRADPSADQAAEGGGR